MTQARRIAFLGNSGGDVFGAKCVFTGTWGDFDKVFGGVEPVQAQLAQSGIPVAGKGPRFNHEFGPPSLGPIKGNQQQVQVHSEGIHGHNLIGECTYYGGEVLCGLSVIGDPWTSAFEVCLHPKAAPVFEFSFDDFAGAFWLEAKGVPREIQGQAIAVWWNEEPLTKGREVVF